MVEQAEQPVAMKKCGICDNDIEEPKFRLHEIGCSRNNYRCKECGIAVAKAEKEEHEAEAHALVRVLLIHQV